MQTFASDRRIFTPALAGYPFSRGEFVSVQGLPMQADDIHSSQIAGVFVGAVDVDGTIVQDTWQDTHTDLGLRPMMIVRGLIKGLVPPTAPGSRWWSKPDGVGQGGNLSPDEPPPVPPGQSRLSAWHIATSISAPGVGDQNELSDWLWIELFPWF